MFDPYLEWLQIPPERRPPTNYELLGLPPFESDAANIHKAALERLSLVRRYQLGPHAEVVTRLLGELSAAFDCLSDPKRRCKYDEQLRTAADARPLRVVETTAPTTPSSGREQVRRRSPGAYGWAAAAVAAVAAIAALVWFLGQPPDKVSRQTELTANVNRIETQIEPQEPPPVADSPIRYFGYATQGPGSVVAEIAPYTNVVFLRDWVDQRVGVLGAARQAGLPMVLCLQGKEPTEAAGKLRTILDFGSDPVLAVCWFNPSLGGYKTSDVGGFGRRLKSAHPKVQFWVAEIDRRSSELGSVPPVVDALVIMNIVDTTAEAVHAKADACLADWKAKAAGRPLIWYWLPGGPRQREGLVPATRLGTLRACLEVARRHQLAGLVFDRYGKVEGQERIPIETRPELVEELRQISRELGFEKGSTATSSPR